MVMTMEIDIEKRYIVVKPGGTYTDKSRRILEEHYVEEVLDLKKPGDMALIIRGLDGYKKGFHFPSYSKVNLLVFSSKMKKPLMGLICLSGMERKKKGILARIIDMINEIVRRSSKNGFR